MLHKIKLTIIRIVTISIVIYVLWLLVKKVSPAINPPVNSQKMIQRDNHGAIYIDMKD